MPTRIINADQVGGTPGAGITRFRMPRFGSAKLTVDHSELANAGRDLIKSLNKDNQNEADNSFISEGMSKWVSSSQRVFEEAKNSSSENAVGFTDGLSDELQGSVPNFILELQKTHRPSQEAVSELNNRISGRIGTMSVDATKFEFFTRRAHEAKSLEDSISALEIATFNTPKDFLANLEDMRDIVQRAKESQTLPPAMLAQFGNAEDRLALSAINGLINKAPATALAQLSAGDFDPWLSDENKAKALNSAAAKVEDIELTAKRLAKEEEVKERDKETADLLISINKSMRGGKFDPDGLIDKVVKSKTLTEVQKARQIIFINNEQARREQKASVAQEKLFQTKRIIRREELEDLNQRGALTNEMIAKEVAKPPAENPFIGEGGAAAWQKLRDQVRDTRPKFFRLERNAKTVSANRGLVKAVFDGKLSVEEIDAMKQQAIINEAPREQRDLLDELGGVALKQSGGLTGQRDNQIYVNINDRIREAKITFGSGGVSNGTVDAVDATVTELITLQRDIIRAERLGKITKDESQSFLTKVMLGLEKQVAEETGLPFWGMGGGPDDIYDGGYEQIVQLLKQNGQEDDMSTKAALMRTFVFSAEKMGLDQMEPGLEKEKALDLLGKTIRAQYAGMISPKLKGINPEELPNAVFISGRVFNLFDGVSSSHPTKRLDGNIVTVKQTGADGIPRIFEYIKGTNPPIVISSRPEEDFL